jgi:heme-degrading monooxygenase HmoA
VHVSPALTGGGASAERRHDHRAVSKEHAVKGRVVFLIRLKPGTQDEFLKAYEGIRHLVAQGVEGHLVDQVCRSPDDPESWLITSEWESLEHFLEWERTQEHRDLVKPMRDTFAEARSLKFEVVEETGH